MKLPAKGNSIEIIFYICMYVGSTMPIPRVRGIHMPSWDPSRTEVNRADPPPSSCVNCLLYLRFNVASTSCLWDHLPDAATCSFIKSQATLWNPALRLDKLQIRSIKRVNRKCRDTRLAVPQIPANIYVSFISRKLVCLRVTLMAFQTLRVYRKIVISKWGLAMGAF